jgi:hypothetical protein
MTPWQSAKTWWDNHSTQDFWEAVGEHLSAGLVHATPEVFLLAREVRWNAEEQNFEPGEPNCWFVTLAAASGPRDQETKRRRDFGCVREFMRVATRPQQYAAWCRRGSFEPRVYSWDKLMKKTGGQ